MGGSVSQSSQSVVAKTEAELGLQGTQLEFAREMLQQFQDQAQFQTLQSGLGETAIGQLGGVADPLTALSEEQRAGLVQNYYDQALAGGRRGEEISEAEMVRRWYPDGKKPRTAAPVFIPICKANPGLDPTPEGGTFKAPLLIQLHSATQGASIAYTFDESDNPRWLLYTASLRIASGKTRLRARAIRIGYEESAERMATFTVT